MTNLILDAFSSLVAAKATLEAAEAKTAADQVLADQAKAAADLAAAAAALSYTKFQAAADQVHTDQVAQNTASANFEAAVVKLNQAIASPPNPQI